LIVAAHHGESVDSGAVMRSLAKTLVRGIGRVRTPWERDGLVLDPEMTVICSADRFFPRLYDISPERSRARYLRSCKLAGPDRVELDSIEDTGNLRVYRPSASADRALLYIHGGGFVIGSIATHDSICRRLARDSGRVVCSLEYRLAPEHPFPAAVEDVVAAWETVSAMGFSSVAVGGDSAGGNLSAVLAQTAPGVEAQLLIYPGCDMATRYPSEDLMAADLLLSDELIRWFLDQYVGDADRADPRLSPLRGVRPDLPPAWVIVAGFDPLRDEGIAMFQRLRDAGVTAELVRFDSLPHGFLNVAGLSAAADAALTAIGSLIRVDSGHG